MGTNFTSFDPRKVSDQWAALKEIVRYDYSLGVHETLLSGTVGSGKTLLMTHVLFRHLVKWSKAKIMIGRQSMPDLKETLLESVLDHMEGCFVEGEDYEFNRQKVKLTFYNGSEILARSWAKKNWKRFGSLKLSFAAIEEVNENDGEYWQAYEAVYQRLGRVPHISENHMVSACNPDTPAHPLYERLIENKIKSPLRHVFYSDTRNNPYLPKWYIDNLMVNLSPIEVERKVKGRWVEDPKGGIYYNYSSKQNYRDETYVFNLNHPIDIMHDFNIGHEKPMSAAVGQFIEGVFHLARTYLVEGADTEEIMEEIAGDEIFERETFFRVFGDASGKSRDTRSKRSDYDIIKRFLDTYRRKDDSKISYSVHVPQSNPQVRKRHNIMNAKFRDPFGVVRFYVYKEAHDADRGFRLTKLKKGADYVENDTLKEQHVTTAAGYWVSRIMKQDHNARIRVGSR